MSNLSLSEEQWQRYLELKGQADDYLSSCIRLERMKQFKKAKNG